MYSGLYGSVHCSKGICFVEFDVVLLCRYVALVRALSQHVFGSLDCRSIVLVESAMVWCSRSDNMCCGVFLGTTLVSMPIFASCVFMLLFSSSLPLSTMIVWAGVSVVFVLYFMFIILLLCCVIHVIMLFVISCLCLWSIGNAVRVLASCMSVMYLWPCFDVMSHVRVSMYSTWPGDLFW